MVRLLLLALPRADRAQVNLSVRIPRHAHSAIFEGLTGLLC